MFCTRIGHYSRLRALICSVLIFCFVFALAGCGDSSSDVAPPRPVKSGGASAGTWILQQLLSGAASYSGKECAGWLLSLVTGGSNNSQDQEAFQQMEADLTTIINDLETIEAELSDVLALINLSRDTILQEQSVMAMKPMVDLIDYDFRNLQSLTSSMIGTPAGQAMAQEYASYFINSDNMDWQIYQIYTSVMGTTPGLQHGGALNELVTLLVAQETGPQDSQLLNRYLVVEAFFRQLVQIQLKGATMEVEGLHQRDNPWPTTALTKAREAELGATPYPGTAKEWLDNVFQPQLNHQVEEFLRCVDRLVLSQCDLRTDITTTSPTVAYFLPTNADVIWARADFIAAQLSDRHQFGLNIRVVGEPDEVESIAKGAYHVGVNTGDGGGLYTMNLVPLGLTTDVGYPVRYNSVEQWWNWPTGATQAYAQWNWFTDSPWPLPPPGHVKFNSATRVDIAKYNFDVDGENMYVQTNVPGESAAIRGSASYFVHLASWYDDDMNVVQPGTPGAHFYGHGTLPIRHRPEAWYQTWAWSEVYLSGYYNLTTDAGTSPELWCRAAGQLSKSTSTVDNYFWVKSGISVPILNGSNSPQTFRVTGNLKSDATNTCTVSSAVVNTAQVGFFFDQDTPGAYKWWDITTGSGHAYDSATISYDVPAGEGANFSVMTNVKVDTLGCSKGDEYSAKAYPQSLYLFF